MDIKPLNFHHLQTLKEHQIIEELAREMGCNEAEVRPLVDKHFKECEQALRQPLPPVSLQKFNLRDRTYLIYGGYW